MDPSEVELSIVIREYDEMFFALEPKDQNSCLTCDVYSWNTDYLKYPINQEKAIKTNKKTEISDRMIL